MGASILAGRDRMDLDNGMRLRLLSALEVLQARREAEELVKLRSRQYAKRQLTWFRRNPEVHWLLWEKNPNFGNARQRSTELLEEFGLG